MKRESVFIVIPTIRNLKFLEEWGSEFHNCNAIIIEDHKKKEIDTPASYFSKTYHFAWEDIRKDFGKDEWIYSRKNAGIRSYGFYKAYTLDADVIITIDDDCYPVEKDFVKKHLENLAFKAATDWFPTYPDPRYMYTRGYPYNLRNKLPVMVSHGLWSGALDLDARTEVQLPKILEKKSYPPIRQIIPQGYFFPMCSMNLAFTREVVPLMYFPLMGYNPNNKHWGYDRYDDIWAGIFIKKIADHLGWAIANGSPFVEHRKASLPKSNLEKEKPGLKINETLWQRVKEIKITGKTAIKCYQELAQQITFPSSAYFLHLRQAMKLWIDHFS